MARERAFSRRRFLAAAAGTAGSAPVLAAAGAGGRQRPPASDRITVGMIGTGRQGMKPNLAQFLELPGVRVVAVCDVDAWRMEQARQRVDAFYGGKSGAARGCRTFRDFRELLARRDIDAVMISTPDHWHVPMGILAARAGKHVCIEKPLSTSIAGGRALCEAVAQHKVVSRTDSEFRSLRPFSRACELVRHGRIGRLTRIATGVPPETPAVPPQPDMPVPEGLDYELWLGPAPHAPYTEKRVHAPRDLGSRPNWMRIADYTNGMIANWGTHLNDIAQWANGTERTGPVEVQGTGEFSRGLWNTIVTFDVRYRYANGVELQYRLDRPYVRFEGTEGWIEVGYPDTLTAQPERVLSATLGPGEPGFANVLSDKADFIAAIKGGGETLEPVEVGHRTCSICQLGLIAATLGYPLTWDPGRERFTDNAANAMLSAPARHPWTLEAMS